MVKLSEITFLCTRHTIFKQQKNKEKCWKKPEKKITYRGIRITIIADLPETMPTFYSELLIGALQNVGTFLMATTDLEHGGNLRSQSFPTAKQHLVSLISLPLVIGSVCQDSKVLKKSIVTALQVVKKQNSWIPYSSIWVDIMSKKFPNLRNLSVFAEWMNGFSRCKSKVNCQQLAKVTYSIQRIIKISKHGGKKSLEAKVVSFSFKSFK